MGSISTATPIFVSIWQFFNFTTHLPHIIPQMLPQTTSRNHYHNWGVNIYYHIICFFQFDNVSILSHILSQPQILPQTTTNIFSEKNGRTALVTKGITSWKVPQFCSKDIIVCQTKINNKLTFLVSLYLDCKVPSLPKELIDLMRNVGNNDVLIGTDSNAHSTVWNCSLTDNRGDMVNKFLIDNNLSCCNIGNNPTFENGSGDTSIIDLTIANYWLSQRIRNWQVEKVLHSTDHFRIRYDISNCFNFRIAPVQTWNYRKGAWSYFKSLLERGLLNWTCPRSWTDASIEAKIKQFNDEVMNALDISCPKKTLQK